MCYIYLITVVYCFVMVCIFPEYFQLSCGVLRMLSITCVQWILPSILLILTILVCMHCHSTNSIYCLFCDDCMSTCNCILWDAIARILYLLDSLKYYCYLLMLLFF